MHFLFKSWFNHASRIGKMLKFIMYVFMIYCWTCSHKSLSKELNSYSISVETNCECGPSSFSSVPLRYYCSQISIPEFSWKLTGSIILQYLPYLRLALISCPQVLKCPFFLIRLSCALSAPQSICWQQNQCCFQLNSSVLSVTLQSSLSQEKKRRKALIFF